MNKYIFLYNHFNDEEDTNNLRMLKLLMPDVVVKPFHIIKGEIESGKSIWVPEEKYLMAWTIYNYDDLMEYMRTGHDDLYATIESGLDWYETHRNNDLYVWYKDSDSSEKEDKLKQLYGQYTKAMQLLEKIQDKMSLDEFGEYIDILENNGIKL